MTTARKTRKTKIERLREANEAARLENETVRLNRNTKKIKAGYDATKSSKLRRQPKIERSDEGGIYKIRDQLNGCNIGRDLERNYSPAKGILHQFKINVVGSLGKIQVNAGGDRGKKVSDWFNGVWSKEPDFRDETIHWSTLLQNVVASIKREGDIVIAFDDGFIEGSGKLVSWEADQICKVSEDLAKTKLPAGSVQDNGLVRDKWGRITHVIVTSEHGLSIISKEENMLLLPVGPKGVARIIRQPWRLNQGRGIPSMITSATNFADLYEILSKELQSAKLAASLAGYTKRRDGVTDYDDPGSAPEFLPENEGQSATDVANQTANGGTGSNYEKFESLTGGFWEYLDDTDDIGFLDHNRPNINLIDFLGSVLGYAGSSMGLARAYTLLRADSSYTSFRGDMVLSWATFYADQKWLERSVCDWVGKKAIAWGIKKGEIKPPGKGWENSLSWSFPKMPSVDELKEANALKQKLKNGEIDFSKILGPDWKDKLEALAEQIQEIKRLELPLSILETSSGNIQNEEKENE